ncbi:uncharacterized protein [Drosophila kikkawai]|uniref:Uncharacterized protein n=1 Tax=Drosophila kikkawai TaxID=30033 RepID=A0ABM4GL06_DROKI
MLKFAENNIRFLLTRQLATLNSQERKRIIHSWSSPKSVHLKSTNMKIIFCCLLIFALTIVYAKSIGDLPAQEQKDVQTNGDVSAGQAQDDNQRKYLEAMFKIQQAKIAQQMWSIFNSK